MMSAEEKKKILERVHADIDKTSIPWELKLMAQLANATQIVAEDCDRRLRAAYARRGILPKQDNAILTGFGSYCKYIRLAASEFFRKVEPHISDATFGSGGMEAYDAFNKAGNVAVRLFMLYGDRVADDKSYAKLFETLRKMPSRNIFSDEDIARFNPKKI